MLCSYYLYVKCETRRNLGLVVVNHRVVINLYNVQLHKESQAKLLSLLSIQMSMCIDMNIFKDTYHGLHTENRRFQCLVSPDELKSLVFITELFGTIFKGLRCDLCAAKFFSFPISPDVTWSWRGLRCRPSLLEYDVFRRRGAFGGCLTWTSDVRCVIRRCHLLERSTLSVHKRQMSAGVFTTMKTLSAVILVPSYEKIISSKKLIHMLFLFFCWIAVKLMSELIHIGGLPLTSIKSVSTWIECWMETALCYMGHMIIKAASCTFLLLPLAKTSGTQRVLLS